ncbi:enoyl-CoA hydratase [Nocardioides mangrovicus]|uniref:Enoyl-CoA hydratase n=1 Tax=Nocardioides mangrovicus TaxID=2478913 RepID=A0A3L8NWA3_9ACTN|nr:crotonase/enoyl-CoA hydratase family protein [Nocardioides mangrovicus]RLV47445.1 enoyl-CoA hydratase [Nocardioides mangrovicus]
MTETSSVRYEPDPERHVAVVTIDRPEARNAVNGEVAYAIEAALDDVETDDELWVTVLTGGPRTFCSGADLKVVSTEGARSFTTRKGGFAGIVRRERLKPLIAAVEGPAVAGGTEILLACDLIVAGRSATFGIPEVKRAIVAAGGGLFRLGRKIPPTVAMEWALTGEQFPADRAYEVGLVNEVCPDGTALERALALADRITTNAPIAVQQSRKVMLEGTWAEEADAWRMSRAATDVVYHSEDFKEGMQAFFEKRPPKWSNS